MFRIMCVNFTADSLELWLMDNVFSIVVLAGWGPRRHICHCCSQEAPRAWEPRSSLWSGTLLCPSHPHQFSMFLSLSFPVSATTLLYAILTSLTLLSLTLSIALPFPCSVLFFTTPCPHNGYFISIYLKNGHEKN